MSVIELGCVGVDSSHLPEFARRVAALHEAGRTRCRVTRSWSDGRVDWPVAQDVRVWGEQARAVGVEPVGSLAALLAGVGGVLVLAVNGRRHLELARPVLERGLATYIDKPLTCSLVEAREILELSRKHAAPCYSASSLRFIEELSAVPFEGISEIVAVDAYGPGELLEMMPHLWHYGCHSVEMVDAILERAGLAAEATRVSAVAMSERHLLDYETVDGVYVRIRLERRGVWQFGATIHGSRSTHSFVVDFSNVYTRLVEGMVGFFEHGRAPVGLDRIVSSIALLEAGNASIDLDGRWVSVDRG